jgi:hypothetical protein
MSNSNQNPTNSAMQQQAVPNQIHQTNQSMPQRLTLLEKLKIAQTEWRKIFTQTIDDTGSQNVNREIFLSADNQRLNRYWGDELQEKATEYSECMHQMLMSLPWTDEEDSLTNIAQFSKKYKPMSLAGRNIIWMPFNLQSEAFSLTLLDNTGNDQKLVLPTHQ